MIFFALNASESLINRIMMFMGYVFFGAFAVIALMAAMRGIKLFRSSDPDSDNGRANKILAWNLIEPSITLICGFVLSGLILQLQFLLYLMPRFEAETLLTLGTVFDMIIYVLPLIVITQIILRHHRRTIDQKVRLAYDISAKSSFKRLICYSIPYLVTIAILFIEPTNLEITLSILYLAQFGLLVMIQRTLSQVYHATKMFQDPEPVVMGGN